MWAVTTEENSLKDIGGRTAISFAIPLTTTPTPEYVKLGQAGKEHTSECPGTETEPKAAEGFLCLYATLEPEIASVLTTPFEAAEASTTGALLFFGAGELGGEKLLGFFAAGSWAVTAA
jgi:hypothetical protein